MFSYPGAVSVTVLSSAMGELKEIKTRNSGLLPSVVSLLAYTMNRFVLVSAKKDLLSNFHFERYRPFH